MWTTVDTSRRRRWQIMLAVGSLAAALTACANGSGGGNSAADSIEIAVPDEPVSLDPCDASYTENNRVLTDNVTEGLMRRDPQSGKLTPELATAWKRVDGRTYDFTLRGGVKFSDGTPLDASAVATAVNRSFNPKLDCGVKGFIFNDEDLHAEAIDAKTVRVTATQADPILPLRVSFIQIGLADPDVKTNKPIGTGPYTLQSWNRRSSITLKRNPNYWGDEPSIASVQYVFRPESSVRANLVRTNEADLAIGLAPQDIGDGHGVQTFPQAETLFLRIDTFADPLNDVDVRRAINLAIDRKGLCASVMQGQATPASQIIVKNVNGYDPSLKVWPYDPAKAKALIQAAKLRGVNTSKQITLYTRAGFYANSDQVMQGVAEMLRNVGLNVKIQQLDAAAWLDDVLRKPKNPDRVGLTENVHGNNTGDAVFTVVTKYRSDGDESTLEDHKLDKMIDRAAAATGDERGQSFQRVMDYITTGIVAMVPIAHLSGALITSDRLVYQANLQTEDILRVSDMSIN
jgi:peptide/nickel transport system substrate-binding protein